MKAPHRPLRLGFIGGGFVGQVAHLSNYLSNPACRLEAICDTKPALRQKLQAHYGFKKAYATQSELLADPEVDAVVAITRRQHTGPLALEVLRAGKHLLTEKPMCHSVEQAKTLTLERSKQGTLHAVGYMRRHDEGVQAAKQLIESLLKSGELGKLNYARFHCFGGENYCGAKAQVTTDERSVGGHKEWPLAPDWIPAERTEQFSSFTNVYCHNINLIRFLLGERPRTDYVNLSNPAGGLISFDFGGFRAVLEAGKIRDKTWHESVELFFDTGKIHIELPPAFLVNVAAQVQVYRAQGSPQLQTLPVGATWSFARQASAFVDDVLNQRQPIASSDDALVDLEIIEEIWRRELSRKP